jgi:hypothetical protein
MTQESPRPPHGAGMIYGMIFGIIFWLVFISIIAWII